MSEKDRPTNKRQNDLPHTLVTAKAAIIIVVVVIILLMKWLFS